MEDGLITGNPAFRLGRYYRSGDEMKARICPLTADEVSVLLAAARKDFAREYPLFLYAVRTGSRLDELIALEWPDIDFDGRFISPHLCRAEEHKGRYRPPGGPRWSRASPGGALQSPPRRRATGPGRVPQRRVIARSDIRAPTTKMGVAR